MEHEISVLTKYENIFCMYKLGRGTPFNVKLIECCMVAGNEELKKLKITFPLARVVSDYRFTSSYWKNLVSRWNDQPNREFLHRLRA